MPKKKIAPKTALPRTDLETINGQFYIDFIPEASRIFNPGDPVRVGNLDNCFVVESFYNNRIYKLRHTKNSEEKYEEIVIYPEEISFHEWFDLFIEEEEGKAPKFSVEQNIRKNSSQTNLDSLIAKVLRFGTNLSPEYQRGLEWNDEEKSALLDSIFNSIEIGRFVFRSLPFKDIHTYSYEIVDGKQRLTTIIDFFLNKFKYRGYYYSELNKHDKCIFSQYPVLIAEIENVTDIQVMQYFKKINKTSHPITKAHFAKIDALIEKKEEKEW